MNRRLSKLSFLAAAVCFLAFFWGQAPLLVPALHFMPSFLKMSQTISPTSQKFSIGALALGLAGCAWSIGGKKAGETVVVPTRGQELIDLQRALDEGAISEEEYQDQRQKILEQ